jgi:hypothetical protein
MKLVWVVWPLAFLAGYIIIAQNLSLFVFACFPTAFWVHLFLVSIAVDNHLF